jgi:hypothetical protein
MDLLQALLKKNKEERITWREFFSHPFIVHDTAGAALTTFCRTPISQAIPIAHGGHRLALEAPPPPPSEYVLLCPSTDNSNHHSPPPLFMCDRTFTGSAA